MGSWSEETSLTRCARCLSIRSASLIFQGQPGKLLTSPAPCPYRRRRTLKRNRPHLRDRKRWIFIRLSLVNRGGLRPRGIQDNNRTTDPIPKQKRKTFQ